MSGGQTLLDANWDSRRGALPLCSRLAFGQLVAFSGACRPGPSRVLIHIALTGILHRFYPTVVGFSDLFIRPG